MRYRLRTLLAFVVGNLALFRLLFAITILPVGGSISMGQATVLGAVAALLPSRRFVGLGLIFLTTVIRATMNLIIDRCFSAQSWSMQSELFFGGYAFLVAAVLLSLRFLFGWRLSFSEFDSGRPTGQFSLAEIAEWTTCVAAIFGCYSAMTRAGMRLSYADLAAMLPWAILIIVPAVPTVFSRSGPTFIAGVLLAAWSVAVCFASWMTDLRYVRLMSLLTTWKLSATFTALFLTALFGNLVILRRMGLRWFCASAVTV